MSASPVHYGLLSEQESDFAQACQQALAAMGDDPLTGGKDGWFGVGIPEHLGGSGGTMADVAVMAEEIGAAHAASLAGWQAGLVAPALSRGDEAAQALLQRICAGAACTAVPVTPMTSKTALDGNRDLTGDLIVFGSPACTHVPVPCIVAGTPSIAFVPADHARMRITPLDLVDVTRPAMTVSLDGVPVGDADAVVADPKLLDEWLAAASLAAALDSTGLARAVLIKTLDYAQQREQFGRLIGSFQAYKHRCATMYIKHKMAQSLAFRAARSAGTDDGRLMALAAGKLTTATATFIAGEAMQLHGGMGFTWEGGVHQFLRRARTNEVLARADGEGQQLLLTQYRASRAASQ
jgi:alkylation response protein AidB-like acyl-CoA dehydrogenase